MLATLKNLLDSCLLPRAGGRAELDPHALQLATAVMRVEVMRADTQRLPAERLAVLGGLRAQFGLSAEEAEQLTLLATEQAQQATDLYAFTSHINEQVDMAQKLRMLDMMWTVAYADGHLSPDERHIVWRIADLLHIPQGAYAHARMRAERQAAGH
jgi:uncharacterized tellurite resistance protein B-like protein